MNKTRSIHKSLRSRHTGGGNGGGDEWIYADEVSLTTGFTNLWREMRQHERDAFTDYSCTTDYSHAQILALGRRIDAYALHTWPSKKLLRRAYEVKVSRSDLLRELKDPRKRQAAMALSNQFYFVVADDVKCLTSELPDETGLMRWSPTTGLRVAKEAPYRTVPDPPVAFMVALARAAQKFTLPIEDLG